MNFHDSVSYLLNLGNEVSTMKLGLENIEKLLAALGNPDRKFLKVQVAGTNGKGSTCAFLDAMCVAAGVETGLTTSPHLISITERIKIGGAEIGETDFARHAEIVRETSEKLVRTGEFENVPTFFEQMTAIALNYFAEQKIELAILETGLGGRFDAMTAARAEIVAVTPIDFDHQEILGDTLAKIAAEKAAIIRPNTRVVLAQQPFDAKNVLRAVCAELGVVPKQIGKAAEILGTDADGKLVVNLSTDVRKYERVHLNLLGKHQIVNAATAVLLAEMLCETGFQISAENIREGLQTAVHKGRLEFFKGILFDGAHNVGGARALKDYLDEFVEKSVTMIFGAMRDKDLREIGEVLFPRAEFLIFTEPDNERAMKTADLMKFVPENFDRQKVFQTKNVGEALRIAAEISTDENLICVTGSLYLVGEAQRLLTENKQPEVAA